ncbi:MAG TPA: penicillin-binding transpeptidase domain-containing protein [Moraxellaceae bacterium]|nr:penicillin-binding transpeptidase domain-containing protein [Moraxellaceae bacterium]
MNRTARPDNRLPYARRHLFVGGLMLVLFGSMAARAAYLHVIDQEFLRKQGDMRMQHVESITAHRGMLRDRNGQPLAVSTPVVSIWINPREAIDEKLDVPALAKALEVDTTWLKQRLERNSQREFLWLKRHLSPPAAEAVLAQEFPGVAGKTEYRRFYPEGEVTAHVLGFTNLDDEGQEGLELKLDQALRGVPGEKRVLRDLKGSMVKDVALLRPARPGADIDLSFDVRTQYLAYRELADAIARNNAKAGTAVALDVETGEVLAMVNQPSYNPNNREKLRPDQMRNRAVTDMFEPGSTMKPFTISAALESGKYTPHSLFNTNPGSLTIYNKTIRDHENYGVIDLGTIITKSSNVGASQIALSLPKETLPLFFSRFGFGKTTGSGFPGESAGRLQPPDHWRPVEIATMSYGYGLTVTALQLAHGYATLAAGGIERPVSFLKVNGPVAGKRVLDEKVAAQLIPMMESVVTADGTAVKAAVPGYRVAGKTGTAHKAQNGSYSSDQYMSTFIGMAPASKPRVVLAVVVDSPSNGQYYGGLVSAPVFSRIMAETLRLMNVEPDRSAEHLAQQGRLPPAAHVGRTGA